MIISRVNSKVRGFGSDGRSIVNRTVVGGYGEIPFVILFSGTTFLNQDGALSIEQVPWHKETAYRLPVRVWREAMDMHFPNSAWLRVRRDTLDSLQRFKSRLTLPTWDETIEALLRQAGEPSPGSNGNHEPAGAA